MSAAPCELLAAGSQHGSGAPSRKCMTAVEFEQGELPYPVGARVTVDQRKSTPAGQGSRRQSPGS